MVTPVHIPELKLPEQTSEDNAYASIPEFFTIPTEPIAQEMPLLPNTFALGSLRDGRLRVLGPIEVVRTEEDGKCVVEAPELNEFGFGDNLSDAIADLQAAIAELYFTLDAEHDRLGPDLAAVWAILSQKLRKAHATLRT